LLSCGLVGLPNAGKSTLFNALTQAGATVAAYPFTTIDPNIGIAALPDARLFCLSALVKPERVIPSTVQFVDVAGLVQGASSGEGLGNQFLGHLRDTDAIVMVLRCFEHPDIPHIYGEIDPVRDIEIISLELILADLTQVERRIERTQTAAKSGDKRYQAELEILKHLHVHLAKGEPARTASQDNEIATGIISGLRLLSGKPILYAANMSEAQLGLAVEALKGDKEPDSYLAAIQQIAINQDAEVVVVSAQLESELNDLPLDESTAYLAALGVTESGLERLVWASYRLLNLITFFTTTGGKEARAWPLRRGAKAPQAAGEIHSDIERGFIRAEVIGVQELLTAGSFAQARERGLLRLEGRDYVVQDGDVIHFRFAV
jgi:ribosome-binding ATPase